MTKIIPILQKRPLPLVAKVESNRMDSQQTAHHREQIHINGWENRDGCESAQSRTDVARRNGPEGRRADQL